jgi:transcription elongation factor GreA
VSFGSSVKILNIETDEEECYTICGVLESEPENGLISIHSPLACAMLGKEVDDQFKIQLPKSKKEYEILEIWYKNIFSLKKNIRTKSHFSFH